MNLIELAGEEMVYLTENSVYIIRENTYCRLPRVEEERYIPSPDLVDGVWHNHVGVWELEEENEYGPYYAGPCLRILPEGRAEGSTGLITSKIIHKHQRQFGKEKVKHGS